MRSKALVELVDVYKTVCDLVGLPLPEDDAVPIDGVSLRPILEAPETASVKEYALSTFPRCAHIGMPVYGARGNGGADNTCLEVERTDFTLMGFTMRTDRYRYTEWVNALPHCPRSPSVHVRAQIDAVFANRLAGTEQRCPQSGLTLRLQSFMITSRTLGLGPTLTNTKTLILSPKSRRPLSFNCPR